MSISWICEFLLMIYTILLKDCTISDESDKEDHKVFMRYHMWMCVQWFEEIIYDCSDTCLFWFWFWMHSQSWLIWSCPGRCALTIQ